MFGFVSSVVFPPHFLGQLKSTSHSYTFITSFHLSLSSLCRKVLDWEKCEGSNWMCCLPNLSSPPVWILGRKIPLFLARILPPSIRHVGKSSRWKKIGVSDWLTVSCFPLSLLHHWTLWKIGVCVTRMPIASNLSITQCLTSSVLGRVF